MRMKKTGTFSRKCLKNEECADMPHASVEHSVFDKASSRTDDKKESQLTQNILAHEVLGSRGKLPKQGEDF